MVVLVEGLGFLFWLGLDWESRLINVALKIRLSLLLRLALSLLV